VISIEGSDVLASLIHHLMVAFGAKRAIVGTGVENVGSD